MASDQGDPIKTTRDPLTEIDNLKGKVTKAIWLLGMAGVFLGISTPIGWYRAIQDAKDSAIKVAKEEAERVAKVEAIRVATGIAQEVATGVAHKVAERVAEDTAKTEAKAVADKVARDYAEKVGIERIKDMIAASEEDRDMVGKLLAAVGVTKGEIDRQARAATEELSKANQTLSDAAAERSKTASEELSKIQEILAKAKNGAFSAKSIEIIDEANPGGSNQINSKFFRDYDNLNLVTKLEIPVGTISIDYECDLDGVLPEWDYHPYGSISDNTTHCPISSFTITREQIPRESPVKIHLIFDPATKEGGFVKLNIFRPHGMKLREPRYIKRKK